MNQTTTIFINQLRSKPLADYTMSELQIQLQEAANIYSRFGKSANNQEERETLNAVWNKMADQYQVLFEIKYPEANRRVYKVDWMLENLPRKKEEQV